MESLDYLRGDPVRVPFPRWFSRRTRAEADRSSRAPSDGKARATPPY
jgi:hypothetical protein